MPSDLEFHYLKHAWLFIVKSIVCLADVLVQYLDNNISTCISNLSFLFFISFFVCLI